jgi:hypothetical protein
VQHVFLVVVNEGLVAHIQTALDQRAKLLSDGHQRVTHAQLEEGPRTAAVLERGAARSTHTAWIDSVGFEWQDLLDAQVELPAVDEVVLVEEALVETEPEISEVYTPRVDEAFSGMLTSVTYEAMQMLVAPAEGDL